MTKTQSGMRRFLRAGAAVACALAMLAAATAGHANSGQILSAWADPTYRTVSDNQPATVTLHWVVLNTSAFEWGCSFCPMYGMRVVASWMPGEEWLLYEWTTDPTGATMIPLSPGATDAKTWMLVPSPPAVAPGVNYLDVYLMAPDQPAACGYSVVDMVRVYITVLEWPDLIIEGASFMPQEGESNISVIRSIFRVRNIGAGPAWDSVWAEVRLSLDGTFDRDYATDPWVSSAYVPLLGPGQYMDFCTTGTVPDAPGGNLHVLFVVDVGTPDHPWDSGGEVPEYPLGSPNGEGNNVFDSVARSKRYFTIRRPELAITSGTLYQQSVIQGQNFQAYFKVQNIGGANSEACLAELRLSRDSRWDDADVLLDGQFAVPVLTPKMDDPANSFVEISPTVQAPLGVENLGSHLVLAKVDVAGVVNEYAGSLENNVFNLGGLQITAIPAGAPDLMISGGFVRLASGGPMREVQLDLRVQNYGAEPAAASQLGVYLVDGGASSWLSSLPVPGLAAGQSHDVSARIPLPSGAPSNCSVVARCDVDETVDESNEDNNEAFIGRLSLQTQAEQWMLYR